MKRILRRAKLALRVVRRAVRSDTWKEQLMYRLVGYPLAMLAALIFFTLWITGRVRIIHPERIPYRTGRTLVASNHPSYWEAILLPLLYIRQFFFQSLTYLPWSMPDSVNFSGWYWKWALRRFIPVPRDGFHGKAEALNKAAEVLRNGGNLGLFPEGMRTSSTAKRVYSKGGKEMAPVKSGVGEIIRRATSKEKKERHVIVLPVRVEGAERVIPNKEPQFPRWLPRWGLHRFVSWFPRVWHPVTIRIGKPFTILNAHERSREEITALIQEEMLKTADS